MAGCIAGAEEEAAGAGTWVEVCTADTDPLDLDAARRRDGVVATPAGTSGFKLPAAAAATAAGPGRGAPSFVLNPLVDRARLDRL